MTVLTLQAGASQLVVDADHGGRWTSLRVDDLELLGAGRVPYAYPPVLLGCFPMAPYAGRLGWGHAEFRGQRFDLPRTAPPHAIHGTVLDVPWRIEHAEERSAILEVSLVDPWPFGGTVTQHLSLGPDQLHARLILHADDEMPAVLGFHPWFRRQLSRGGSVEVELEGGRQYARDADGLPTGELVEPLEPPWDDCFVGLTTPLTLRWPGALTVSLSSSHSTWVVFTERQEAVCLEPQTAPPDALRLGLADIVPAGGSLELSMTLAWQRLPAPHAE